LNALRANRVFLENGEATMSTTIPLEEAQLKLKELIHRLAPGEELIITENQQPVAKLMGAPPPQTGLRLPPGLGKGMMTILADDDEHLKDFADYMQVVHPGTEQCAVFQTTPPWRRHR
jgi:antitoxin (DNA-binding transcriptional repressor) of toxin-antitoxin stability system